MDGESGKLREFARVQPLSVLLTCKLQLILVLLYDSLDLVIICVQLWAAGAITQKKLECGPMPNVMAALPNICGAAVWLTLTTRLPCSNAAKTRNPLKLAGVPQTPEPISAVSGPKFAIL